MIATHILTQGFMTPNGTAFLRPIVYYRRALRSLGIRCRIFTQVRPDLTDCDVLMVDSKYFRDAWSDGAGPILEQLGGFREKAGRLFWFDTTDSSGAPQAAVLPAVDRYYKSQLLRDRSLYRKPLYGQRIFTDFYHRNFGIVDDQPEHSKSVEAEEDLAKLRVSWNSALADYTRWGLNKIAVYRRLKRRFLLGPPGRWVPPSADRPIAVSARFGISYWKATVRFQRERVRELLKGIADTSRVPRGPYLKEMERSRIVVAPFGWGELTCRDYETFLAGSLLVKPEMSHLETWPDLYQDGVTMLTHDWEMNGLVDLVERVSDNYRDYLPIAASGQQIYRDFLVNDAAREAFTERFATIVRDV